MTVDEFVFLLTDELQTVAIYDYTAEDEVFCGSARTACDDYGDYEILSIDIDPNDKRGAIVIINIETDE